MTLGDIARWFWRGRESNSQLRPSASSASMPAKAKPSLRPSASMPGKAKPSLRPYASMPAKEKPSRPSTSFMPKAKIAEEHVPGQKTTRYGYKRFGKVDQRQVDTEIDGFILPAEIDDWTTCSDSDGSDWSIGWNEPLSSAFSSDSDNSFGVLVPCYGPSSRRVLDSRGKQNEKTRILGMMQSNRSRDSQEYVKKWLECLKK